MKTALDKVGNVYVTGSFWQNANFGSTNLISRGGQDIVLAKYNNAGNLLWAKQAGGTGDDVGNDVAVDGYGYVYITGTFQATAQFDYTNVTATAPLPNGAVNNLFVAKYSPFGQLIWVQRAGGISGGQGLGIAADASGNVYSTGSYIGMGTAILVLDKRDPTGKTVWHQEFPGVVNYFGPEQGNSIKIDQTGNLYLGGQYSSTITLGGFVLSSTFGKDIFVAKFGGDGTCLWARKAGGDWDASAYSIAIDAAGNAFIAGYFDVAATFGTTNLTTWTGCNGNPDAYLAKYDPNGNFLWVDQITRNAVNRAYSVAVDKDGNAYVTGSVNPSQVFLSKYDGNGNLLWELDPGHGSYSGGYGVSVDSNGDAYMAAWGTADMAFDSFTFTNLEGGDLFVSKISEHIPPVITSPPSSSPPGLLSGSTFSFSVTTRSTTPVTYQWQLEGTNLPGATQASLTVTNVQLVNQSNYVVLASNAFGTTTSAVATLTVYFTITAAVNGTGSVATQPATSSFLANTLVTLTAVTNAGFPFTGWSGDISGTTNPVTVTIETNLYVTATFADSITNIVIDNNDPRAEFSGPWQTGTGSWMYGPDYRYVPCATNSTASAIYRPTIVVPGYYDVSIWCPWSTAFSSNALWSVLYSGGTLSTNLDERFRYGSWLPIASEVYFATGTNGYVSLSNATGEPSNTVVVADAVRIWPSTPPTITWNPLSCSIRAGGNGQLMVYAYGSTPLNYQWQLNASNVPGATSSVLALTQIQPSAAGVYTVTVTNLIGSATSSNALLTVTPPGQPRLLSAASADRHNLQLTLTGDSGVLFTIQTSSNLVDWIDLTNLLNVTGTTQFSNEVSASSNPTFYRAKWFQQ